MSLKKSDRTPQKRLTILIPCLNEEKTIKKCITVALCWLKKSQIAGEVLVVDNGSSDHSVKRAQSAKARVVTQLKKGYGSTISYGILHANSQYIIMGDADLSYDFSKLDDFLLHLEQGYDLVIGNRFTGRILPGAMPLLHQIIGNPVLTFISNLFFQTHIGDYHCGLRGFKKSSIIKLKLKSQGMEYASEMIVKSALNNLKIKEVPIVYYPDQRGRKSHLRTFRDGWRHLRFLLLFSPHWLFFVPGIFLMVVSSIIFIILFFNEVTIGSIRFGSHSLLLTMTLILSGYQIFLFSLFTQVFSQRMNIILKLPSFSKTLSKIKTESILFAGTVSMLVGFLICTSVFYQWYILGFGDLDQANTMKTFILGVTLILIGLQTCFGAFFINILRVDLT